MATSIDKLIDEIISRETGGDSKGGFTNDPRDAGGRTIWGISERANPDLWVNGPPTREQAVERYFNRYVKAPGFDKVTDPRLQAQLTDWGVLSGPSVAIQKLQGLVGATIDGVLGPKTLALVNSHPEPTRLNNQLALERVKMVARIIQRSPSQSKFAVGWITRCLEFVKW